MIIRALRRLGRRGAMLFTLGLTFTLIGAGVLTRPVVPTQGAFLLLVPPAVLGSAWAVTGLLAAIWAWRRDDTLGWVALYVMPALYVLSYGGAFVLWLCTAVLLPALAHLIDVVFGWVTPWQFDPAWWLVEPPYGDPTAWYNAALRIPFIAIVLICSGWRESRTSR